MSPRFRFPLWLWLALAVSTAASLWVAAERYRAETENRAVHLIVDMPDVRTLASVSGSSVSAVLQRLKSAGITAVTVAEETFDDLILAGQLRVEPGRPVRYIATDPAIDARIRAFATYRLAPSGETTAEFVLSNGESIPVSARIGDLRTFGVGFSRVDSNRIADSGLGVIARLTNQPLGGRVAIDAMLAEAKSIGAEGILFGGDQVIGRRELVVYAAEQIRAAGFWIGPVEFTSQGGLPRITKELQDRLVRVHSMVASEIDRNEPPDIVDRYVRAVVERGIKGLFLRPISLSSEDPLESFGSYIAMVRSGIERDGYQAKPARPEMPPSRPLWTVLLCGLGIIAAGGFLAFQGLGSRWGIVVGGLLLLLTAGAAAGFGLKFLTLAGAIVFPTLALLAAFDKGNPSGNAGKWIAAFFWITGLSIIGGLHVAALLTLPSYILRIEQFFGVRIAHFLPPVFVAVYLIVSEGDIKSMLRGAVKWMDVLIMFGILGVVFVMLSRTGNDNPGDVSALELKLRNFLDRVLPERPRTKEFLIGHPALILSLSLAFRGSRGWLPLTAFLAAVGQVSILNTFCHLHTPIAVSLMRVAVGVVMGGIVGLIALGVFNIVSKRRVTA